MTASKKEIELWRLSRFRAYISDFPSGSVEATEEPDFLVRDQGRVVGIELTDLHRATKPEQVPEQATEAMRKRVISRAQEIYIARQLPAATACFLLNDRIHLQKAEVEPLATEMADLVANNLPEPNSSSEVPRCWEDKRSLPSLLHSLSVHRLDVFTNTFFSAPGAAWIARLDRDDIERALSRKEQKYRKYRTKCDEVWLVINTDIESTATWFEFNLQVLEEPFTTHFERVFLAQHFAGKAHELCVTHDGAAEDAPAN